MSRSGRTPGEFWLDQPVDGSDVFYICWYDAAAKRTGRKTTGTSNPASAQIKLAEHVLAHAKPEKAARAEAQIAVFLHQWNVEHGAKLPSAKPNAVAVAALLEELGDETVSALTPERQENLVMSLRARGWAESNINRSGLTILRASLRYAWKKQRLESVPFIPSVEDNEPPPRHIFTAAEFAEFLDRAYQTEHLFRFCMLMANTLSRPCAIFDLKPFQVFDQHGYIDLNPAGRKQTKKYRPRVPITETLRQWLPQWPGSPIVSWGGEAVGDVGKSFAAVAVAMGLVGPDPADPEKTVPLVTPYAIRHTMATMLAKAGVPREERERFMGHKAPDASRSGEAYVHFEPTWLRAAKDAIDDYFAALPLRFNLRPPRLKVVVGAGIEPAAFPMSRGHSTAELTDRAQMTRNTTFK